MADHGTSSPKVGLKNAMYYLVILIIFWYVFNSSHEEPTILDEGLAASHRVRAPLVLQIHALHV